MIRRLSLHLITGVLAGGEMFTIRKKSFQNCDFFFSESFLYCKQSVVYNVSRANEEQFVLVNDVDIVSNIVKTF